MTVFAEMLIQLKDPPHVTLVVLLVLRVNRIELTGRARGGEQR